ncbi:MAG: hypothetical protein H0X62_03555 [Bacteroidetes bacterium]|nr:hypothetical protein [Bacteroidota bacterium]
MKKQILILSLSILIYGCGKEPAIKENELYKGHWTGADNTHEYNLIIPANSSADGEWNKSKPGSSATTVRKGPVRVNDKKLFVATKGFSIDKEIHLDGNWWKMELDGIEFIRPSQNETHGEYTFWIETDLGGGPITVFVDGKNEGAINNFFPGGVHCGNGDVNVSRPAGTYKFRAEAQNGKTWIEDIEFIATKCENYQLTN